MTRRPLRALLAGVALALTSAMAVPSAHAATPPVAVPADGRAYFGVHLDSGTDTPAAYAQRSGLKPAVFGRFAHFPMTSGGKAELAPFVDDLAARGGALLLTLEPQGLASVTDAAAADLATTLGGYNARGVDVFLRFAHEMNGSWYSWGQQPAAYKAAFRTVAAQVRASAPRTAMLWAPNYGGGYPFTGGTYAAKAGTADFAALDTDSNGVLNMADDPYTPYYPGDDIVDWVGLTAYHFGNAWPWGENEVPEAGKFGQLLTGTYTGNGLYENQSAVPDFYASFAVAKAKPMAVAETSAFFNESPPRPGDTAYAIKSAWLEQVYATSTRDRFPLVKLVNWFEIRKYEGEAQGVVDWRLTFDPALRDLLTRTVTNERNLFAGPPAPPPPAVAPGAVTGLTGSSAGARVTLSWSPPAAAPGATVTEYQACSPSRCQVLPASARTATFDSQPRKTSVTFAVRAYNGTLAGPETLVTVRIK